MGEIITILIYAGVIVIAIALKHKKVAERAQQSSSMPHRHSAPGEYVSFNKYAKNNSAGTMPHIHETRKYTASMSDASKLPPGYILLNGEPVRVADLEGK